MSNYAVRVYDPELKTWLIAEAERRGAGVRTSDVAEDALHRLRDGSGAPVIVPHAEPSADAVRAAYRAVLYDEVPQHTADDLIEAAEARVGKTGSVAHVTHGRVAAACGVDHVFGPGDVTCRCGAFAVTSDHAALARDERVDATSGGGLDDHPRGRSRRSRVGHAAIDAAVPAGDPTADIFAPLFTTTELRQLIDEGRGLDPIPTPSTPLTRMADHDFTTTPIEDIRRVVDMVADGRHPVQRVKGPDSGPSDDLGF